MASDFPLTQWGMVVESARSGTRVAEEALSELCQQYWPAVYAAVRRRGYTPPDAEDLTQDFFAHILAREWVSRADPLRGKFRSFVLTSLTNFLNDKHDRQCSEKRGGKNVFMSLDTASAENSYTAFGAIGSAPDRIFDAQWARSLVGATMESLREQYEVEGRSKTFDVLRAFLTGDAGKSYEQAADALGFSVANVKTSIYRLRQRFAARLREDVTRTLADPGDADAELRYLCSIL